MVFIHRQNIKGFQLLIETFYRANCDVDIKGFIKVHDLKVVFFNLIAKEI